MDRPGERVGNEQMESGEFRAGTLHEALNTQEPIKPFVFFCGSMCFPLSRCMAITKSNSQTRSRTWGCLRRRAPVLAWTARTRTTIPSVKVMGLSSKGVWTSRRYRLGRVARCPTAYILPSPFPTCTPAFRRGVSPHLFLTCLVPHFPAHPAPRNEFYKGIQGSSGALDFGAFGRGRCCHTWQRGEEKLGE